jgi:hypothetical protein
MKFKDQETNKQSHTKLITFANCLQIHLEIHLERVNVKIALETTVSGHYRLVPFTRDLL